MGAANGGGIKEQKMQTVIFHVTVDGKHSFDYDSLLNGQFDVVEKDGRSYHILKDGQSYTAEKIEVDVQKKEVTLRIGNQLHRVKIDDQYDLLVQKMGLSANVLHKISEIKAPMPGLVLSINVEPGQEIVHGQPLLVLEAMKMENVLKSPGEGVVKKIHAIKGNPVEKGQLLIELE